MEKNNLYLGFLNKNDLENASSEDKEIIQIKLWTLLGKVTQRYTMNDSSSVPIEVAEELLKSICFLLNKSMEDSKSKIKLLKDEELEEVWKNSWKGVEKDIAKSKDLLEKVINTSICIENISYDDTVLEIARGLKFYDYRFLAHEVPCSIDYQLSNLVSEKLQGIDFINEYLKRLLFENEFCNNFDKAKIIELLKSYCEDYKELLINIFEPVFTNIIGLEVLGSDIYKIEIEDVERKVLLFIFNKMDKSEIKKEIITACNSICNKLKISKEDEIKYMKETALNLLPRIEVGIKNNSLENIFLKFKEYVI